MVLACQERIGRTLVLPLWLAAVVAALGQGERSGVSLPAGIQHRWVGPGEAVLLALPFEPYDDSLAALLAGARLERLHRWDPLRDMGTGI